MHTLEKIHFTTNNGLVFCNKPDESKHISERYHIQETAKRLEATAVLFRRKYDKSNENVIDSKPVLYIYSEKDELYLNSEKHKELHAKIWSAGEIDVYFIISKTTIDIFNARKPAEVQDKQELNLENLRIVSEALEKFNDQRFSAMIFGKGVFWEQEDFFDDKKDTRFFRNRLKEENTPFHQLLEYLMAVRKYLKIKSTGLLPETIDKLLIVCILVKFLEEIKNDDGRHTLRMVYKKYEVCDFAESLEKQKCLSILKDLASEFNGNIFDNFTPKEKQQIEKTGLKSVADFLRAELDIPTRQLFLWRQYNFNHLPVELISSIYENFLPKEKGVVYTPPFLVNTLIDEVMPLDKAETYFSINQFKVLDPSCGSGVFLVAAYKRMLQWWSVNHYEKTLEIKFPDKKDCQKILEDNIFGVDINPTATLISIFSLTIALLDKLEPKEIWNNFKLNSLRDNIQTKNFFEWATANENKKFDLVIGNPPFNPISGTSKQDAVSENQIQQFGLRNKDIPNNNFALKFFEGAMFFGKKMCLIIPSNVLLYNKTKSAQKYRNRIFTKFTIEKIFDFTHLREVLFVKKSPKHTDNKKKTGRTPVCAVFANSTKSQGQKIGHTVIKRIASVEKKMFFEIDHYDRHVVRHDWAIDGEKQFIWKTNLLGGGRLFHLIYRLSSLETLKQFIKCKENNEWIYSVGYIIKHKKKKNVPADFITDKLTIKSRSFKYNGDFDTQTETSKLFVETRTKELYESPHIIFKLVVEKSKIPMTFSDKYLCFNSSFVGIHAPQSDTEELYRIYDRLHKNKKTSNLYQTFILATSSKTVVYHETSMVKEDIDNLPYPEKIDYLIPSPTEEILVNDVLAYYRHLGKSIKEGDDGYCLHEKVSQVQLKQFGRIFCRVVNSMHAEDEMFWQIGNVYETPEKTFIIYQLIFGGEKENNHFEIETISIHELDKRLHNIIFNDKENANAVFTRITRIYGNQSDYDYLFLIKPTATRYWLNSIALRDADETIWDYYEAGY